MREAHAPSRKLSSRPYERVTSPKTGLTSLRPITDTEMEHREIVSDLKGSIESQDLLEISINESLAIVNSMMRPHTTYYIIRMIIPWMLIASLASPAGADINRSNYVKRDYKLEPGVVDSTSDVTTESKPYSVANLGYYDPRRRTNLVVVLDDAPEGGSK